MTDWKQKSERGRTSWQLPALVAFGLVLAGFVGFLVYQHFENLEGRINSLQGQVQEALEGVGQASERSQAALERSTQAEQNAQQAALGRVEAEQASAETAAEAAQARQEADLATQQAELAREEADRIRERREAEIERLQRALSRIVETERTALGLVMRLGSDSIRFDFDKAVIRPEDRDLLSRIAGVLLASYGFRIHVYGHTDDVGTEQYNQDLSERRAGAVRNYFVDSGIDSEIISIRGYGKSSPRVPGTNPEARARNRRVEIGIVDTVIDYQGEAARRTP